MAPVASGHRSWLQLRRCAASASSDALTTLMPTQDRTFR